jgi:hypothetical protein
VDVPEPEPAPGDVLVEVIRLYPIRFHLYLQDDEENEAECGLSKSGKELKKLLGRAAGLNESDADEDEDDDDVLIHSLGNLIF